MSANEIAQGLGFKKKRGRIQVANKEERTYDGIVFHSKREMVAYISFKSLAQAGAIAKVEMQVPYPLIVNGVLVTTWVADFVVTELDGRVDIYDSKGWSTPEYKIKKKLFEAIHAPWRIVEI